MIELLLCRYFIRTREGLANAGDRILQSLRDPGAVVGQQIICLLLVSIRPGHRLVLLQFSQRGPEDLALRRSICNRECGGMDGGPDGHHKDLGFAVVIEGLFAASVASVHSASGFGVTWRAIHVLRDKVGEGAARFGL